MAPERRHARRSELAIMKLITSELEGRHKVLHEILLLRRLTDFKGGYYGVPAYSNHSTGHCVQFICYEYSCEDLSKVGIKSVP